MDMVIANYKWKAFEVVDPTSDLNAHIYSMQPFTLISISNNYGIKKIL